MSFKKENSFVVLYTTDISRTHEFYKKLGAEIRELEDDKVKELIVQAGGLIKAGVFENLWNCKEILFEDPNGYKFALYSDKMAV